MTNVLWGVFLVRVYRSSSVLLVFLAKTKKAHDLLVYNNFWKYGDPVATRISRNPNLSKCEDVRVESWNPKYSLPLKAHGIYWTHPKVIDRVVQEILA